MTMDIRGIPASLEETRKWVAPNMHGYYVLQPITSDGIADLLSKGYDVPYTEIQDEYNLSSNKCFRALEPDSYCEIISTYEDDTARIDHKWTRQHANDNQRRDQEPESETLELVWVETEREEGDND